MARERFVSDCLLASALCGLAFAAGAQTAGDPVPAVDAPRDLRQDDRSLAERNCLRQTGSRIVASENQRARALNDPSMRRCAPARGRSYTEDDLDRTGQTNVADALRMLDPSID